MTAINTSNVNAFAAAVANIVSGAVINVLGLSSSSNSSAVNGTGAVTPVREEVGGSARDILVACGVIRNRNFISTYNEQHIQLG